jgi:Holliday junction resolvase RusA-like endonuclease
MKSGLNWTEEEYAAWRAKTKANNRAPVQTPHLERAVRHESVGAPAPHKLDKKFRILVHSKRRRIADPDGISAKAAIDGLTAGGIFADDSAQYVESVSFSQEQAKEDQTVITIWECEKP